MLNKITLLFNSPSKLVKYMSILTIIVSIVLIMYIFLTPEYKNLIDAFILRILIFSKTQVLLIFKSIIKGFLGFFWGVFIMQFWYGFVFGGIKKFILMSLSSKFILLLISLAKRYLIDNVLMVGLRKNFLRHINKPISKISNHYLQLIKSFSLKKRIIVFAGILGIPLIIISPILYFIGIFTFIIEKVFSANMWKTILFGFLKILTVSLTFFSNIWDSWLAPIIEVILFTWIIAILERIPFIGKLIKPIYVYFNKIALRIKDFLDINLNKKIQKGFGKAIFKINYHVDITILKSENEKILNTFTHKKKKTLTQYIRSTMKTQKTYTYEKRLNSYLTKSAKPY